MKRMEMPLGRRSLLARPSRLGRRSLLARLLRTGKAVGFARCARARLGLGAGFTLLAPFLRTLDAEAQGVRRKRFLLVLQSNGLFWERFVPPELVRAGDSWEQATSQELVNSTEWTRLPRTLASLERHRKRMLIVDGLANRQNGLRGNHENGSSSVTCVPNLNGGEGNRAGGPSIDQVLASSPAMGGGVFRSVDLLARASSANYSMLAYDRGATVPVISVPRDAVMRYFGGLPSGNDPTAVALRARKKRLFDLMRADIARVSTALPGAERAKLDQYLDSVGKMERRLTSATALSCPSPAAALPAGLGATTNLTAVPIEDVVESMFTIAAEALACGMTQVASVSICTGIDHYGSWTRALGPDVIAMSKGIHSMSHGDAPGVGALEPIYDFVSSKIAAAADRLQMAKEGGRSVFDDTVIVWHSVNGGYHHHPGQFRWNGVVIGDAGGKLRADGRYLKYPSSYIKGNRFSQTGMIRSDSSQTHSWADFYCTLAHALGAPTDKFGAAGTEPVKGPLPEALA